MQDTYVQGESDGQNSLYVCMHIYVYYCTFSCTVISIIICAYVCYIL